MCMCVCASNFVPDCIRHSLRSVLAVINYKEVTAISIFCGAKKIFNVTLEKEKFITTAKKRAA